MQNKSQSLEELKAKQKDDFISLGIFKPKKIYDLEIVPDNPVWKDSFLAELRQQRLWETRTTSKEPPRKVPWKFYYKFACDDSLCKKNHRMHIEDWEVGALYWKCVDNGDTPEEAAQKVKSKFLNVIFAPDRNSYFFVGTVKDYGTWVIIGTFWPKVVTTEPTLFPLDP